MISIIRRQFGNNDQPEISIVEDEPFISSYFVLGLDGLLKETKFTRDELQQMYRGFKQECPKGLLDQDTFLKIFCMLFPGGDPSLYCNRVFLSFDRKKDGKLTFEDFVLGLSRCLHGNNEEKLRWAFEIYDIEGKGFILENELFCILSSIYNLIGVKISEIEKGALTEHTNELFQLLDIDCDGKITEEEFVSGALMNPEMLDALNNLNYDDLDLGIKDCSDNDSIYSFNHNNAKRIKKKRCKSRLTVST